MESSHKKPYETLILGRYRGGVGRGPPMANKDCTAETEGSIGGRHPSTERTIRSASEEHRSVDPPDPLHSRHCNDTLTTSTSTHAEERSEHTPSVSQAEDQVKPSLKRPRLSASEHKCLMFADDQGHTPNVPQHGVLLCVPSKTHSRKPYLGGEATLPYIYATCGCFNPLPIRTCMVNPIHPIAPVWAQRIPISIWVFIWRF